MGLLYVAGDIVDYGFFPCEVIRWLREHNAHAVAGNHDVNMLRLIDEKHQVDLNRPYTFAEYNLSLLQKDDIDYLRSLPETLEFLLDGVPCLMTHYYTRIWILSKMKRSFVCFGKHTASNIRQTVKIKFCCSDIRIAV